MFNVRFSMFNIQIEASLFCRRNGHTVMNNHGDTESTEGHGDSLCSLCLRGKILLTCEEQCN